MDDKELKEFNEFKDDLQKRTEFLYKNRIEVGEALTYVMGLIRMATEMYEESKTDIASQAVSQMLAELKGAYQMCREREDLQLHWPLADHASDRALKNTKEYFAQKKEGN